MTIRTLIQFRRGIPSHHQSLKELCGLPSRESVGARGHYTTHSPSPLSSPVEGEDVKSRVGKTCADFSHLPVTFLAARSPTLSLPGRGKGEGSKTIAWNRSALRIVLLALV